MWPGREAWAPGLRHLLGSRGLPKDKTLAEAGPYGSEEPPRQGRGQSVSLGAL